MKKKITIEVDTDTTNERIIKFLMPFIEHNFQKYKDAKVSIEDVKNDMQ